jgi:spermidine dehydrogenase
MARTLFCFNGRMNRKDRELGMGRRISRRDLLHGMSGLAAGALLPGQALADQVLAMEQFGAPSAYYPPSLTGLRGSHAGSFEVAHELARHGRTDWGQSTEPDSGVYDLVVAGGGVSGLAAAWFYRQKHPDSSILILDNHDDFGGHAKRNEFRADGQRLIGYGGSQTLEGPSDYSLIVKSLMKDIGIDFNRFYAAYDQEYFRRFNLSGGTWFGKEQWGVDRLVPYSIGMFEGYLQVTPSALTAEQAVAQFPISPPARAEFVRLLTAEEDGMSDIPADKKWAYLTSISYRDFLSRHAGITEEEIFAVLQDLCVDSCVGIEAAQASTALGYNGLPGWNYTGLPVEESEPYIHHFPDGNAGVARLLVRQMIPASAQGSSMEDIVTEEFDYSRLDEPSSAVRLRLNSTVVRVQHEGDAATAKQVRLSYVQGGALNEVRARHCVLACYNAMIPHLCPELPQQQKEALALQVKAPILYTNVALRNWRAWQKAGVAAVLSPGAYHSVAMLDFPVSMGGYQYASGPDQPVIVHMERFIHRNNEGLTQREQHRVGRHELLSTPFEEIERQTRRQLAGMLADGGFDPAEDIAGITVNRWSHGYANRGNPLFVPYYDDDDDERWPHVQGRKPYGRITIANCDAAGRAWLPAAVEQAHRAVGELES